MARLPRVILPAVPLHITQRGVDRCVTFLAAEDFAFYRWALQDAAGAARCAVHAYVLMTNHVHLLATPMDVGGPARMMRALGTRYVRYFNDRYRRTGTLWEGRYRASRVETATYLFACSRYIETNPVRAGMVASAAAYEWSSFRHNAHGDEDATVIPHPQFIALGPTPQARCAAYQTLFARDISLDVAAALRAAQHGRPRMHSTPYRQAVDALLEQGARPERDARAEQQSPPA